MKLKLKEDPNEWRNFALICCAVVLVGCAVTARAGANRAVVVSGCGLAAAAGLVAIWYPPAFRGFYRAVMALSFRIGQVVGKLILGVVYVFVVTPLGLAMRVVGKNPLDIRTKSKESYWKAARQVGNFDKQF